MDEANGQYERLGEYTDDATHRSNGGFVYWPDMLKDGVGMRTLNPLSRNAQLEQQKHAIEWAEILREFEADTEYGTLLKDTEKEALATLIVTDGDVETEYAAFVERWDSEGGPGMAGAGYRSVRRAAVSVKSARGSDRFPRFSEGWNT